MAADVGVSLCLHCETAIGFCFMYTGNFIEKRLVLPLELQKMKTTLTT